MDTIETIMNRRSTIYYLLPLNIKIIERINTVIISTTDRATHITIL